MIRKNSWKFWGDGGDGGCFNGSVMTNQAYGKHGIIGFTCERVVSFTPIMKGGGYCGEVLTSGCSSWTFWGVGTNGPLLCYSGLAVNKVYGINGLVGFDCQ